MRARSVSQTQRGKHDAHRFGSAANIPHRARSPEPGGARREDHANQRPRGPMGRHTGAHVQELGERARVAVESSARLGGGLEGRACAVRVGGEFAEQEDTPLVEPQPRKSAPDAGERVQSSDRHSRRRCKAGQHR